MNNIENHNSIIAGLSLIGINYKSSPIEVRERFAFLPIAQEKALSTFSTEIGPTALLSTCNRTELYFSSHLSTEETKKRALDVLSRLKNIDHNFAAEHLTFLHGQAALNHLFRVSAGLESMILGEGQILNQMKNAYAQSQNFTDALLNQLFQRALAAGKKVRAGTEISKGAMSVPAAALQIVQKLIFPTELSDKNIMVIGSGEVAHLCLELLHSQGASNHITLVNRSETHSLQLTKYGISHNINYSQLHNHLQNQELILVCTGAPHYVISAEMFDRYDKKVIVCDMSLPRNVDPALKNLPFINLIDLDFLNETVEQNLSQRASHIKDAEKILEDEMSKFLDWCINYNKYQIKANGHYSLA